MAIIESLVRYFSLFLAVIFSIGTAISSGGADLILQKVPALTVDQAPNYPQNLARVDLGAQIEAEPKADVSASFLSGDPTPVYQLKSGTTTLLVSLAKIENVDRIALLNIEANGSVAIATASAKLPANSPQWHDAGQQDLSSGLITAKIGPAEAKYVRLTFNVNTPGQIGGFGVYSASAVSDFTVPRPRKIAANSRGIEAANYNLADLHTKARAIYVSSGNDLGLANNMIDGQPGTAYTFAANDATPAAIIDLGRAAAIQRISTLAAPASGAVTFYVLNALPAGNRENTDEPAGNAALRLDPGTLAGLKSVGTRTDDGTGRVALDFPETIGRYVMATWTPMAGGANFSVAEIAVFGPASSTALLAASTRNHAVDNSDSKTVRDTKDTKDFSKEIPGEGPEEQPPGEGPPPGLPQPPPFVFIPQIVPTSL